MVFQKNETKIGDNVFIGTNATLVAPLVIDSEAFVAAGSTITTDVSDGALAVGRAKQKNIDGWGPAFEEKATIGSFVCGIVGAVSKRGK